MNSSRYFDGVGTFSFPDTNLAVRITKSDQKITRKGVTGFWFRMPNFVSRGLRVGFLIDSPIVLSITDGVYLRGRTVSVVAFPDSYGDEESNLLRFGYGVISSASSIGLQVTNKIIVHLVGETLIDKVVDVMAN